MANRSGCSDSDAPSSNEMWDLEVLVRDSGISVVF